MKEREAIIKFRNESLSIRQIGKLVHRPPSTVVETTKRFEETGSNSSRPGRGSFSVLSDSSVYYNKEFITRNNIKIVRMVWPPQNSDLNPIEQIWDHLDSKIQKSSRNLAVNLFNSLQVKTYWKSTFVRWRIDVKPLSMQKATRGNTRPHEILGKIYWNLKFQLL